MRSLTGSDIVPFLSCSGGDSNSARRSRSRCSRATTRLLESPTCALFFVVVQESEALLSSARGRSPLAWSVGLGEPHAHRGTEGPACSKNALRSCRISRGQSASRTTTFLRTVLRRGFEPRSLPREGNMIGRTTPPEPVPVAATERSTVSVLSATMCNAATGSNGLLAVQLPRRRRYGWSQFRSFVRPPVSGS